VHISSSPPDLPATSQRKTGGGSALFSLELAQIFNELEPPLCPDTTLSPLLPPARLSQAPPVDLQLSPAALPFHRRISAPR
jgi:hypothetical protein